MTPLTRRNTRLLAAFNFCTDFRIYGPVMVVYFNAVTGSLALATLLFSIAKVSSSAFEVPTGVFSDLIGRRLTLLFGQIASVLSIALYAAGHDFAALAAGAVLEGLAFALFSGNNEALLYDTLKDEGAEADYPEWQGRVASMFQLAAAISAIVAMLTLGWLSLRAMFVLSLVPQALAVAFAFLIIEPARRDGIPSNVFAHLREALAVFGRNARLRELSLAAMLAFALGEAKYMFRPAFFALLWPTWALGLAAVLTNLLGALGFRIGGTLIRRFGELRLLIGANAAGILLNAGAVALPCIASPVIMSLTAIFFGPAMLAQGNLMQKAFTDAQRATMASLISLGGNLMFAVTAFAIGWFADRVGARYALLTAELLTIIVALLYWRLYGRGDSVTKSP